MKINYQQAVFLKSAAQLSQLPDDTGSEVAFVGRSNAGKSSALNTLTRTRNLARTSKTPGRTQLINLFTLDETRRLVDLPGYGYAQVPMEIKLRWQKTLALYLEKRQCLKGLVLLMDIRHPLKEFDINMLDWAQHCQLPIHILLTKADKLTRGAQHNSLHSVKKALSEYNAVSVQLFSSLSRLGLEELEAKLDEWYSTQNETLEPNL